MSLSIAFLVQFAIKLTILLGTVALIDVGVLRGRASAAVRHLVWTVSIAGALLLPLLGGVLPAIPVRLNTPTAWQEQTSRASAEVITTPARRAHAPSAVEMRQLDRGHDAFASHTVGDDRPAVRERNVVQGNPSRLGRMHWGTIALAIYAMGIVLVLLKLALDQMAVRALIREATPVTDGDWAATLSALALRIPVAQRVRLLRSNASIPPLTAGVLRSVLLIPADANDWSAERREAVLLHELAHAKRHDCLTQTIAAVACALYWPHPLAWWGAARLRAEREIACDDAVTSGGVDPHHYANQLLSIARGLQGARPVPALAVGMAAGSPLEHRIRAVIDARRRRGAPDTRTSTLIAALMLATIAPLSAVVPAAAAPAHRSQTRAVLPSPSVDVPDTVARTGRLSEIAERTPSPIAAISQHTLSTDSSKPALRGGELNLRLTTQQEGRYKPGMVHISFYTPGLSTAYVDLARFEGLSADQLRATTGELHFKLRRDAGAIVFTGAMRGREGYGRFEFVPDPLYAEELARRGITRPTDEQQFVLGLHDVPFALLDELDAKGYAKPTLQELLMLGGSSIDVEYVREMEALGYHVASVGALLDLEHNGVTPTFIRELAADGRHGLSLDELRQLRMRGPRDVSERPPRVPSEAEAARRRARPVPTDADSPLDGTWSITPRRDGSLRLDIDWSDVNQWNRDVDVQLLTGLSASTLASTTSAPVSFTYQTDAGRFEFNGTAQSGRASGRFTFAPNRAFAATLRDLGVRELGDVSTHDLKNLGFYGMSGASVRELITLLGPLTKDEVIELAIREVTPAYVRAMQEAGVQGSDSEHVLVELRFLGVSPSYARDMGALGYRGIPYHQLIALRRAGVTPDFVRAQQAPGQRRLTPDELIELRRRRG